MKIIEKTLIVPVEGELDHHLAAKIRRETESELRRTCAKNVAFDFRRTTFMDSSGVGMIMGRCKTVRALGGGVIVFGASENVKRMIEMSGISGHIVITEFLEEGLERVNGNDK